MAGAEDDNPRFGTHKLKSTSMPASTAGTASSVPTAKACIAGWAGAVKELGCRCLVIACGVGWVNCVGCCS